MKSSNAEKWLKETDFLLFMRLVDDPIALSKASKYTQDMVEKYRTVQNPYKAIMAGL